MGVCLFSPSLHLPNQPPFIAFSENSPSTDISDRLFASMPLHMSIGLIQRNTKILAELDKYAIVPNVLRNSQYTLFSRSGISSMLCSGEDLN